MHSTTIDYQPEKFTVINSIKYLCDIQKCTKKRWFDV